MQNIMQKQKMLEEIKFSQREIKNQLTESIKNLKNSLEEYKELNILTEEQLEFLQTLEADKIEELTFEEFKAILIKAESIKNELEENSKVLAKQIEELEKGVR